MKNGNNLSKIVQNFFQVYLPNERALSPHTIYAYRDTIKLYLLSISSQSTSKRVSLDDLNAKSILNFLEALKTKRNNTIKTQNQRLAALKSFFLYLRVQDPTRMAQYDRIDHIKLKRAPHKPIDYFTQNEMKAIFSTVNLDGRNGQRDFVLLKLLYNSGARVQELCDLKVRDIRLTAPYFVQLKGKGSKTRRVPLWKETVQAAQLLLDQKDPSDFVFTIGDKPITRFGVRYIVKKHAQRAALKEQSIKDKKIGPHTFRHTTAMHLLQGGVDISVIKTWLGHVNLNTTHGYIEIDMEMKRKAMAQMKCPKDQGQANLLLKKHPDIVSWLSSI